eukprot:8850124-Prorocentrum_lima.AAC.1
MSSDAQRPEHNSVVLYKRKLEELSQQHAARGTAILAKLERHKTEVDRLQLVEHRLVQVIRDTEKKVALEQP